MCFSPYSLMRQTVYTYKLHMNVGDTAAGTARINLNLQGVTDWKCGRINTGSMLFQQRPSPPRRSGSTHPPHKGQAAPIPPTKVRQHPSPPQRLGSTHPHHKGQAAPIPTTKVRQHPSPRSSGSTHPHNEGYWNLLQYCIQSQQLENASFFLEHIAVQRSVPHDLTCDPP